MHTQLKAGSEPFESNRAAMEKGLERLRAELATASAGGGPKYQERHKARGKLLPRERIERLLDEGSYLLELMPLAGLGVSGESPGAGVVGGIGRIAGRDCLVVANEATVRAGAISPVGLRKLARLAEVAWENRLPTVYLVESAGAELTAQSEVFVPGGREFRDITRRSKERLVTISVVFGTATAGGAYIPGMSDYVIMVRGQARAFLGGPPLVKMAIGEIVDEETLGGAEMHSSRSGVSDYLAEDEDHAISLAREILGSLPHERQPEPDFEEPVLPPEELVGVPSASPRRLWDPREIVWRIVDGSRFHEFKPQYGATLVTGYASILGIRAGILANHGILDSESAAKGAQFIALCNQQGIPLVFLQNITGFMVGKAVEETGIIRNGAKLINAVANSEVPAITLMVGNSYGAGNYAMCGRAYGPRFLFSWPNHRIGVMGAAQLAGVMEIIRRDSAQKEGKPVDEVALTELKRKTQEQIEGESDAFFATGRLWDDGVIDPRHTRHVLGICLGVAQASNRGGTMAWGVFRH